MSEPRWSRQLAAGNGGEVQKRGAIRSLADFEAVGLAERLGLLFVVEAHCIGEFSDAPVLRSCVSTLPVRAPYVPQRHLPNHIEVYFGNTCLKVRDLV